MEQKLSRKGTEDLERIHQLSWHHSAKNKLGYHKQRNLQITPQALNLYCFTTWSRLVESLCVSIDVQILFAYFFYVNVVLKNRLQLYSSSMLTCSQLNGFKCYICIMDKSCVCSKHTETLMTVKKSFFIILRHCGTVNFQSNLRDVQCTERLTADVCSCISFIHRCSKINLFFLCWFLFLPIENLCSAASPIVASNQIRFIMHWFCCLLWQCMIFGARARSRVTEDGAAQDLIMGAKMIRFALMNAVRKRPPQKEWVMLLIPPPTPWLHSPPFPFPAVAASHCPPSCCCFPPPLSSLFAHPAIPPSIWNWCCSLPPSAAPDPPKSRLTGFKKGPACDRRSALHTK